MTIIFDSNFNDTSNNIYQHIYIYIPIYVYINLNNINEKKKNIKGGNGGGGRRGVGLVEKWFIATDRPAMHIFTD